MASLYTRTQQRAKLVKHIFIIENIDNVCVCKVWHFMYLVYVAYIINALLSSRWRKEILELLTLLTAGFSMKIITLNTLFHNEIVIYNTYVSIYLGMI